MSLYVSVRAINIESGLNDGVALPAVLFLAVLAASPTESADVNQWLRFGLAQVVLGPVVGIAVGYLGARLLDVAATRDWTTTAFQGVGILALAVLTYVVAEVVGGNGFIAAFVGGIVFGNTLRHPCTYLFEFMESEGQLLMLVTFFVFGAMLLPEGLVHIDLTIVLYAVLSLTLIRMVPIAISLVGTGMRVPSQLFLGWFGPRGLASILFVLLVLDEFDVPHKEELLVITVVTVGLSALLHGISAVPFAGAYGRMASRMGECEENQSVAPLPLREGHGD